MDIQATLDKFAKLRIVVIGDIMLDHYIMGDATRISPEAPVPVVSVSKDKYIPGGAANVANNLANIGVETILLGRHGSDKEGKRIRRLLKKEGATLSPIGIKDEIDTILKTRVIVQRQQLCRIDRENPPAPYALNDLFHNPEFDALLRSADAILLSDYAKGSITQELLNYVRELVATLKNKPLLVIDPKPKRELDISGLDLMTPNLSEALQLAGLEDSPHLPFDKENVSRIIFEKYKPKHLVITLGPEGMVLFENGKQFGRIATEAKEVFDVSGAGDTVVSVLTAALASGKSLREAARLANKAAGIVVGKLGTAPITSKKLLKK